jgi:hypothetical protein
MDTIMKINKKLLMLGATFALTAQIGTNAMAADVDGSANALVIEPLSIVEFAAMDFGTVAGGPGADTIILTTAGGRSVGGTDARLIATGAGAAGNFTITGEPSQTYILSISAGATLTDGGANSMTVDTFTNDAPPTPTLDGAGSDTLLVGGTLNIGANQAGGTYSTGSAGGSPYVVTVNYN